MLRFYNLIVLVVAIFINGCETEQDQILPVKVTYDILDGWDITRINIDFYINPADLFFINSNIGFVVGDRGAIYKTTNSGEIWQKKESQTTLHLRSVYFLNENIGFISGESMGGCSGDDCNKGSVFLKTVDGGNSWSKKLFPKFVRIRSLHFFNETQGLSIIHTPDIPNSKDYHIAKTSDGGDSWEFVDLPIRYAYDKFYSIDDVVFVNGENQKIYKTKDYGLTWEAIDLPNSDDYDVLNNLYFYSEKIIYLYEGNIVYKSIDGGITWNIIDFSFSNFETFHLYNESEGFNIETRWEGGCWPKLIGSVSYQTSDGWKTWNKSELIDDLNLGLTFFPARDLGFGFHSSSFYQIIKKP